MYWFIYVCVWNISGHRMCSDSRGQNRMSDALEREFQMVLSHHLDPGTWTQVFCKNSKCCSSLSHLSQPPKLRISWKFPNSFCWKLRKSLWPKSYALCVNSYVSLCFIIFLCLYFFPYSLLTYPFFAELSTKCKVSFVGVCLVWVWCSATLFLYFVIAGFSSILKIYLILI